MHTQETSSGAIDAALASVDVRAVTKCFGPRVALDDLTLCASGGEIYCLLGGTGAGKTVTLRILLGLIAPTSGHVLVAGHDVAAAAFEARQQATFVAGTGMLLTAMTVRQNLRFFVRLPRAERRWNEQEGLNALRIMGVPERVFDARVKDLPRNIIVALWLAIAWLRASPVVLLDEPTIGLDTRAVAQLQTHLLRFRERGQAVLIATADVLFASQVADRIGVLKRGRKVAERTRTEVLGLSLTELYVDYIGRPPTRASLEHPTAPRRLHM
jgi:ABC-2 type transport system ATP-binding protein